MFKNRNLMPGSPTSRGCVRYLVAPLSHASRRFSAMAASKLPLLALPHPLLLLPASRFTMPVHRHVGEAMLALIEESDALPVVAAVPVTSPTTDPYDPNSHHPEPMLAEWGTAARVLRIVRPPTRSSRQPYLVSLHGLTRVRIGTSKSVIVPLPASEWINTLVHHEVEYPPTERVPSREAVDKFKYSATRLLDRLAKDSVQHAKRDGYVKIAAMLEDVTDARAPWMADVLVGTINGEYVDKLGEWVWRPCSGLILVNSHVKHTRF